VHNNEVFDMRNKMRGTGIAAIIAGVMMNLFGCIGAGSNSEVVVHQPSAQRFPEMVGIDLTGAQRRVPQDLPGTVRLVVAAYQREQQADVDTWIANLDRISSRLPEVEFCELPVIPKGSALFRFYVNNGMRSGITDPQRRLQVITVYTDVPKFLEAVGQPDTRQIMAFLLHENGAILGKVQGRFSDEQLERLLEAMPRSPAQPAR
jgi:hypothetical protein